MILFQKKDAKFEHLRDFLKFQNIVARGVEGSSLLAPFVLGNLIFKKQVRVYVFRYLNDYPSLFKSILRLFSEGAIIILCKSFNIKMWWLCHNVDKESEINYPILTTIRRRLITSFSIRILTTNKLLVPYAKKIFKRKEVISVSLGYIHGKVYENLNNNHDEIYFKLKIWLDSVKNSNTKIIFCIGTPAKKALHFQRINEILDILNNGNGIFSWYAVVVGSPVASNQFIYSIEEKYMVDENIIKFYCDYYYRVMDDYSISYTLFEASYLEKPIITENFGILPEICDYYNTGVVIDIRGEVEKTILEKESFDFDKFKNENNWEMAAEQIALSYRQDLNDKN